MDGVNAIDLKSVLEWLIAGGAPIAIMYAISLLAENWSGWHTLPKSVKFLVPMILSAGLAIGAQVLTGYADVVAEIAPWWKIVLVAVMSYIGSQKAYMSTKASGYGTHNSVFTYEVIEEESSEVQ